MKNKLETQKHLPPHFLYPLIPQFTTTAFAIVSPFPKVDRKGRNLFRIRKKNLLRKMI